MAKTDERTASKTKWRGSEFVQLFAPVIDTLRELGDSGRPKEVSDNVALRLRLSEEELNKTNKNGQSCFENKDPWARFYLAKAGLIDTSRRGVWTLTEAGRRAKGLFMNYRFERVLAVRWCSSSRRGSRGDGD